MIFSSNHLNERLETCGALSGKLVTWQHSALSSCSIAFDRKWACQHFLRPRDKNITKTYFAAIEKFFRWRDIKDKYQRVSISASKAGDLQCLDQLGQRATDELLLQLLAFFAPCSSERNRSKTPLLSLFPLRIMYHCFCYFPQLK